MDKIAAYHVVLRKHPLWESDYQEKEAGIAAVRAAGSALGRGANTAYKAVGGPDFVGGVSDAVNLSRGALKAPGPLGQRLFNAGVGVRVGANRAANTPMGMAISNQVLPVGM